MKTAKNISVSFRVSERFQLLLTEAAARERRSKTNLIETLLFAHCDEHGIEPRSRALQKKKPKEHKHK
jgi:hypothetical protein